MTLPSVQSRDRRKDVGVFDYDEEEERVKEMSMKLLRKFDSPETKTKTNTSSDIDKYDFLRFSSTGEKARNSALESHEVDSKNSQVLLSPDVIIYGDMYCTNSRITFSGSGINVESSSVNATNETFSCQWTTEDIIKIESQWCLEVETAFVNVLLKSRDPKRVNSAEEIYGIDLLQFYVYDPKWFEGVETIKLLDSRYEDIWFEICNWSKQSDSSSSDLILTKEAFYLGAYDHKSPKRRKVFMSPIEEEVQDSGEKENHLPMDIQTKTCLYKPKRVLEVEARPSPEDKLAEQKTSVEWIQVSPSYWLRPGVDEGSSSDEVLNSKYISVGQFDPWKAYKEKST